MEKEEKSKNTVDSQLLNGMNETDLLDVSTQNILLRNLVHAVKAIKNSKRFA